MKTICSRLTLLPLLFLVFACSQPDLHTVPFTATNSEELARWNMMAAEKLPPAEYQEIQSAFNEIKMQIMQRKEATGTARITQALADQIHGKTIHDVLVLGYTAQADWVEKELLVQRSNLLNTETALNGPGSETAKEPIRQFRDQLKEHIEKNLEPKLANAKARLAELAAQPAEPTHP